MKRQVVLKSGSGEIRFQLESAAEGFEVVLDDGARHRIENLEWEGASMRFETGGRAVSGLVRREGGAVIVVYRGRQYRFAEAAAEAGDPAGDAAAGRVEAPMTGTVRAVLCAAGDRVARGAPLLTVEAMKMEHRLSAPAESVVEEVMVGAGDRVDIGQLLVRLAPPPEAP